MTRHGTASISHLIQLTDSEAGILRRVAAEQFKGGQSELGPLSGADFDRLLKLRLIADTRAGLKLTVSGQEHFDALPRATFADKPRRQRQ